MAQVTFKGNTVNTSGDLPKVGAQIKDCTLVGTDLSEKKLSDYKGKYLVMNIFPSVNTGVCATSVRKFNEQASSLDNTKVLCISKDLPFAQQNFCAAEGLNNVEMLSDFRTAFGIEFGVQMIDGPLQGLLSRAVVVADPEGKVIYNQQVAEITSEPDYDAALQALK